MAPDPHSLRFFVDESLMGLGKALAYARTDVVYAGHALVPGAPTGALDTEWIPVIAARGLSVIGRDRHMRTRPAEVALWKRFGLRVFYIAGKKDLSTWDNLVRLVRRWQDIERTLEQRRQGPWLTKVFESRVKDVAI
jgi:hypothetical protein